ncbi:MAG: GDP-mannose-dependent alpha-mannosyltransferase [Hyphomicrobiales bacterium]|nr:GDP-mannose-dependent alpha-mannosyltransferase [Hyphomicrobiales bacterium]
MRVMIVTDAWFPQTNGVVRCLDSVGRELRGRGIDVQYMNPARFWTVPMPTYPEIRLSLAPIGAVAEQIDTIAPDRIHIATEGPLGLQAKLHCDIRKYAYTTSYHTRFPEYVSARMPVPPEWSYAYLRWFHATAAATLVPTPSVGAELEARGFEHVRVWSRGVDAGRFMPGPKTEFLDLPGPHLLYVGRVAVEKNVAAFLALKTPGTKIVVGDGPELEVMRNAFPEAVFLGAKHGDELAALYRSADVFVFPSKTDTFGNVMTEALSSGVPVAAFPVSGPIDVLTDPLAGAMHDDLGVAVERALTLSRTAARNHARRFTWSHCADQFLDALVPAVRDRAVAA